jgi:sulfur carrier protein
MQIVVNGENKIITDGLCVQEFLEGLNINLDTIVVECDSVILKKEEYPQHILRAGNVLEIIRFIGGG